MKIAKKQYGGPVYSPQGLQNVGNQVLKFIEDGGVKGWLDRRKDRKFIEDFKKRNPTKEEVLNINPKTGLRSEKSLVSEDWAIASAIFPALGGPNIKSKKATKEIMDKAVNAVPKRVNGADKYVSIETLQSLDDIPEISNSIIKSQNEFFPYKGNFPHFEKGLTNLREYLRSSDYRNQIRKNYPNISDSEIDELISTQINNINRSNIWYSNQNIIDKGLYGMADHLPDGTPELQIFQSGDPSIDRMFLIHEALHGARGPKTTINPIWTKLVKSKLVGDPVEGKIVNSGNRKSPLGIPDLEYLPGKDIEGMKYLAHGDEARVRALLLRYAMQKSGMSYDDASKYFYVSALKGRPLGGVDQLYDYFTPESIKKYIEKVFTIGIPTGIMLNQTNTNKNEQNTNNMIR